ADHRAQPGRTLDREQLRALPPRACRGIRGRRSVALAATVPADLAGDDRGITPESQTDLPVLQALGQTTGDFLTISQHQHRTHGGILSHRVVKIKCYDRLSPRVTEDG